jgi:hypothetical protein
MFPGVSNFSRLALVLFSISAAIFTSTAFAQSGDWRPQLQVAGPEGYTVQSEVRISIPASVPEKVFQWLALEMDDTDVSQLVGLEQSESGSIIVFTPPEQLTVGPHVLRLVEYNDRGDIIERGYWNYLVADGGASGDSDKDRSFSANTSVDIGYRAADSDLDGLPKSTSIQGSTSLNTHIATANWKVSARADLLFGTIGVPENEQAEEAINSGTIAINRNELELGEFLVEARSKNLSAMLGNHAVSNESLIMRGFNRRGISASAQTESGSAIASGFAFRTEPISGWRNGLGVTNNENRVVGGLATVHPFSGAKQALTVTASCLSGEGKDAVGVSLDGDDTRAKGDACSLVGESRLAGDRVKLRGEYAHSRFDFDADKDEFEKSSDNAFDILAVYSPFGQKQMNNKAFLWDIGMEIQEVGLFFRSLANPTLPSDKKLSRLFTNLQYGGLSLQLQGGIEEDNVDDEATLPTMQNRLGNFVLSYTPDLKYDDQGMPKLGWYGLPTFSFSSQYANQRHVSLPSDLEDYRLDTRTLYNQLNMQFQYQTWSWMMGYGQGDEDDLQTKTYERLNQLGNLALNWQFSDRLSLSTQGQYNVVTDDVIDITSHSRQVGLNADTVLVRDKLTLGLGASLNLEDSSDDSIDADTRTYDLNLNWMLIQARNNKPGVTFWMRGEKQEIRDNLAPENDLNPYQVFVGARIDWTLAFPGQY